MTDKVQQGKDNRKKGAYFERKVRKYLEKKGWIVDRWTNNITEGKLHPAKSNRFNMRTTGFPDFIYFREILDVDNWNTYYQISAIECKTNGNLSKIEKEKCQWYLKNKIFERIYVAFDNEGEIDFKLIKLEGGKKDGK